MKPIAPMLATHAPKPFHRPGWVYEEAVPSDSEGTAIGKATPRQDRARWERRVERRKYARTRPRDALRVEIGITHEGRIVDVSFSGACVEHPRALRVGDPCVLRFRVHDRLVALRSQVVWSRVLDRRAGRRRGDELLFQSGFAFEAAPAGTSPLLADLVGEQMRDATTA